MPHEELINHALMVVYQALVFATLIRKARKK